MKLEKKDCRFVHCYNETRYGGLTIAYLLKEKSIIVGLAYCHDNDTYSRKEGTAMAVGRINDYLQYGYNAERDGTKGLRDSTHGKIVAFELESAFVLKTISIALMKDIPSGLSGLAQVLSLPKLKQVTLSLAKAIEVESFDDLTIPVIDDFIKQYVFTFIKK